MRRPPALGGATDAALAAARARRRSCSRSRRPRRARRGHRPRRPERRAYGDARLRALKLGVARLVVPYDAATSQPQLVAGLARRGRAAGMQPHVAFEHLKANGCPARPASCPAARPTRPPCAAFIARFPQVRIYTTWNEANHESQPVSGAPRDRRRLLRGAASAACPSCTVVAGDVLDSGGYIRWLERFQAATDSDPQLWGLHNYGDVTYATTEGTDAVLRTVSGQLWIEETGGIVVLRNSRGRVDAELQRGARRGEHRPRVRDARGAPADHADVRLPLAVGRDEPLRRGPRAPRRQPAPELRRDAARDRRPARAASARRRRRASTLRWTRDVVEGAAGVPARPRALHGRAGRAAPGASSEAAHPPHVSAARRALRRIATRSYRTRSTGARADAARARRARRCASACGRRRRGASR